MPVPVAPFRPSAALVFTLKSLSSIRKLVYVPLSRFNPLFGVFPCWYPFPLLQPTILQLLPMLDATSIPDREFAIVCELPITSQPSRCTSFAPPVSLIPASPLWKDFSPTKRRP